MPPLFGVFGGVRQKIREDLLETCRVCVDGHRLFGTEYIQLVSPLGDERPDHLHRAFDDRPKLKQFLLELNLPLGDAGDIEEVVGQAGQRSHLSGNDLGRPFGVLGLGPRG